MILICGIPSEPPIALAVEAAEALGVDYVVFNQRHAPYSDITLELCGSEVSGKLWIWEREFPLSSFAGVYTRLMDSSDIPELRSSCGDHTAAIEKCVVFHTILNEWFELTAVPVLNRISAMASNGSKPYQAQLIAGVGFAVPDTLITNDPDAVLAFAARYERVVYKSTSAIRSIVQELPRNIALAQLERIRALPTQFQQFVDGTDVRVHVVGQRVFATEIKSTAIDYRYAYRNSQEAQLSATELPNDIAQRCLDLAARLCLPFCGIDLKRSSDGQYYCFEANPSPAYSYYQEGTGQQIASAVIQFLVEGNNTFSENESRAGSREQGGRFGTRYRRATTSNSA
jgi:hypothetical protein